MNLKPDTCTAYNHAAGWIPGRLTACVHTDLTKEDHLRTRFHDKARQKYNRSVRMGYVTGPGQWSYRTEHLEDIRQINLSMPDRQGRAMHPSYATPYIIEPGEQCPDHYIDLILCVDPGGCIVGYCEWYRVGEFAYTSRILGHADHLRNGIMYAVILEFIAAVRNAGCKVAVYGEWHSGHGPGLQFFKQQCGFKPEILM